ncbi:MAG: methylmalonyl-CoA mutase [Candidatus Marinimicrobia bacterium]|nr:methylmalonyl-CoA mutase [Candidatus Neomarinimicrobiota bacterium]MBL7022547.1 methylmalonyl-CoA mutase [Candidatus Neomarinimicrobiota bacterium]MBL7108903.1 methylmalonyl-CoA mutase [Candidatus Neomarinimicrobiota bacterium]
MTKKTHSGIELRNYYGDSKESQPGEFPFTNGVYPNMYRGRLWTMRQYAGFASAEESNKRYRYLLEQGVMGLSIAFDLPTQTGYDSDHQMAEGEIGKVGVAISSLADMEVLFDKIPLDQVSVSMTINSTAAILLAMISVVAEKQGVDPSQLRGTIQNDILKEYIARGTYIYPPQQSMRVITDIFEYCNSNMPKWNTISISGYHIREAGSTAVQELAFTLANGIAYVESAIKSGLNINQFGKRLSFFFNSHNYFFEEIAKFRAARRMWAHIMKERFGATEPKAMMCRFHTQTAGSTLAAQQIDNNVVRTALQATASVLGGTQSLHTNSRDEALALPTEESVRLALRTQQIIGYESGIPDVVDPLAGSYYIESLTDELEKQAFALIDKIDKLGGAVSGIDQGFQQNEIARSAFEYQQDIDNKEKIVIGVNKFTSEETEIPETQEINEKAISSQLNRLAETKKNRNQIAVESALDKLKQVAESSDNLIPHIKTAVENYATLGEISEVLREVFGEYQG